MYQVLLVDDEPLILSGIKFMIDWQKNDCQIADTARNGQQALEKLRALRAKRPELLLEVDGGVNRETASICRENGADVAVAGTAVFRAENIPAEIALLRGE